jgi:pyruvate,water dikinase
VGCNIATDTLTTGMTVTVCCAEGDEGHISEGKQRYRVNTTDLGKLASSETKMMVNIGNPNIAFRVAQLPADGVGLAREEFIINDFIGIHPMALLRYHTLSPAVRDRIDEKTKGYHNKADFFVDRLAEGVAMISAAFFPNPVIVRLSDFKTNEYANLLGGDQFEPKEENPMIGFRGASRYYDERFRDGFALECAALKKVRDDMGLTNLKIMVPFCRTVMEGQRVVNELKKHGLVQGVNGLELYVMCEVPSNVIDAGRFCDVFDGFSIGSNDLTQLTLGVDRDSQVVSHLFDERDAAVLRMIKHVIHVAKSRGRKIGICGQAPSDYPEFSEFLVKEGIDSISLNPDALLKTRILVNSLEQKGLRGTGDASVTPF